MINDATMSDNDENRDNSSLQTGSPFKGYRGKSRASCKRKETRGQGSWKERKSSSFPPRRSLTRDRLPLEMERLLL